MFEFYQEIVDKYQKLPLQDERNLVALAQKGKSSAQNQLLLHLVGFFLFRIKTTLYPKIVKQCGEDILQNCLELAIEKIYTYRMRYRNKLGKLQPVYFRTYLWKSVTGLMLTSIKAKKEICFSDLPNFEEN